MQITYIGRHTGGVEVGPDAISVAHGATIDLPDELAKSLLEQRSQWEKPKKSPAAEATKKENH
jgi:hypothetical protein